MSRNRQSELKVAYDSTANNLVFRYSPRGFDEAVGLRIVPEVILGISPRGRVLNWQIEKPQQVLARYLEDPFIFVLKPDYYWKRELDQMQVGRLLVNPIADTEAFLSRWIIGYTRTPYERR